MGAINEELLDRIIATFRLGREVWREDEPDPIVLYNSGSKGLEGIFCYEAMLRALCSFRPDQTPPQ